METPSTPIQEYFGNSTIFVVGATGLLGSLLIEKLLRTCTGIKRIYVLLRLKKGLSSEERFRKFFDRPIFEKLKLTNSEFLNKVFLVTGDCSQPNLGLSETDLKNLTKEVNCIFYCAANINFEEVFRASVAINVVAVRDMFKIAKSVQNLKSIVYVSTAFFYGNKNTDVVYEKVDDTNNKLPQQLQTLCDHFDDEFLKKIKPILINKNSNIYATTKWAAEILIKTVGEGLPVAVVRPSLITPTLSDPVPGWIDNVYGPIGAFISLALGIIRVILCKNNNKMDLIPADLVTNCLLASAWDISSHCNNPTLQSSTIKIYNCVSSAQNPTTYGKTIHMLLDCYTRMPYSMQIFYDKYILTSNLNMYYIIKYTLCILPAHIVDFASYFTFNPTKIAAQIKLQIYRYERILKFSLCDWDIRNDNVRNLWQNLHADDKTLYNFDVSSINWDLYIQSFVKGVRIYLLKDPMETVPTAVKRRSKLKKIFYCTHALVLLGFILIIYLGLY